MKNFQIFDEAARLVRANRLAWLYIGIALLDQLAGSNEFKYKNPALVCVLGLVGFTTVFLRGIFHPGLVYDIAQRHREQPALSISEAWARGKANFWRYVGLALLFAIPVLLLLLAYWAATHRLPSPASVLWLLPPLFLDPVIGFGLCAIMLDHAWPDKAASMGLRLTQANFGRVTLLAAICILLEKILLLLALAIVWIVFPMKLSFPVNFDIATYANMVSLPAFIQANSTLTIITFPWQTAVFTLAYLQFTKAVPGPELEQKQATL